MSSACQLGRDSEDPNRSLGFVTQSLTFNFLTYKMGLTKPTYYTQVL